MTIIRGECNELYHANPAIGVHRLLDSDAACGGSPAKYYMMHVRKMIEREETDAMMIGTATHTRILEGRAKLLERYVISPKGMSFAKKEGKDWKAAQTKRILKHDDAENIERMATSVLANADAQWIMSAGQAEVVSRLTDPETGLNRQCRFDWEDLEGRQLVGELKTINTITEMRWDAFKLNYDRNAAWYMDHAATELHQPFPSEAIRYFVIAVEKECPWTCQVFRFSHEDLVEGHEMNRQALKNLKLAYDTDTWPDLSTGVVTLSRPARMQRPSLSVAA